MAALYQARPLHQPRIGIRAFARIAVDAIEARYPRLAGEAGWREPRGASLVVMQRFGSDLRLSLHLQGLFLDGA